MDFPKALRDIAASNESYQANAIRASTVYDSCTESALSKEGALMRIRNSLTGADAISQIDDLGEQ